MKKAFIIILLTCLCTSIFSQKTEIYSSSGFEIMFSGANLNVNSSNKGLVPRFAPVFNIQENINFDFGNVFGLYAGLSLRNVGFIYETTVNANSDLNTNYEVNTVVKKKFRTYNIGIPVGFKLGNFKYFFFYGGYQIECPIHYKEKTFINNEKQGNLTSWFSDVTPYFSQSLFLGLEIPYGLNIKVQYYLTEFFDTQSAETNKYIRGTDILYKDFHSNIITISLCYNLFQNTKMYYKKYKPTPDSVSF
jgi:hypothetical protein